MPGASVADRGSHEFSLSFPCQSIRNGRRVPRLHPEQLNSHLPHHVDEHPQFQLSLRVFRKIEIEAGVTWNVGPEQRLESSSSDVYLHFAVGYIGQAQTLDGEINQEI